MKRMISVAVIGLAASVALAATGKIEPLKAKTGLWQMTESVTWTGLPPQMAAMMKQMVPTTYKSCVKEKDLSSNPWADGSGEKCKWTALNSTGTDMEVQATSCKVGNNDDYQATADLHGKIHILDSEHGTGSFDITANAMGQTMHGHATYTGKWIAVSCPADMN